MQYNAFKCLCVIYSWYVYIEQISRGPARLPLVHVHVSTTSNFLKCYLKSVPALCLSPLTNGKLALSHLVFYSLVLFEPFLLKSIAGLLCMQENIEDSRKGDQCLEQHNILPTSMVRPRFCHQKETAGSLYLPRSVVFRSLFRTPVFANTNFFLSVAVALEILISLSLSLPSLFTTPKIHLMT